MHPSFFRKPYPLVIWGVNLALLYALAGCSLLPTQQISPGQQVSEEPPKALKALTSRQIKPRLLWQKALQAKREGYVELYPTISAKNIVAAGHSSVSSFNKNTGILNWKEELGETVSGGVNAGDNAIFVGTENGNAVALDSKTGKTRWVTLLNNPIVAISTTKNGKVVFRTLNGKIHALSTTNGELLWQRTHKTPVLSLQGSSTPVLAGPYVVTGFDTGSVVAYELDSGKEVWAVKLGIESGLTELSRLIDIDAEMKAVGTALFAVSYQGIVAGIDMRTGKVGWSKKISSFAGIDANDKELFLTDNVGEIWKLNSLTGEPAWSNDDLLRRFPTAPALIGTSHFVVGDSEGYLHWYDTQNGEIIGRTRGDSSGYNVAPIVDGNTIYTLGKGGLLSAYTLSSSK